MRTPVPPSLLILCFALPLSALAAPPRLAPEQLARGLGLMARRGELSRTDFTRLSAQAGLRPGDFPTQPTLRCGTLEFQQVRAWASAHGAAIRLAPAPSVGFVQSATLPLKVHYEKQEYLAKANLVLAEAERAWQKQVVEAGYAAPWTGEPGSDPHLGLDLFVAQAEGYAGLTTPLADVPSTPRCDCSTQVIIDAWLDGDALATTVWHEFNHATQAATDCAESISAWEMFATAVEYVSTGRKDPTTIYMIRKFQRYPEFPLDYWTQSTPAPGEPDMYYQYGASLFPLFLLDRYGAGDLSFLRKVWESFAQDGTISTQWGMMTCDAGNSPTWFEGLDRLLQSQGSGFADAFGEFSAWRAVVGTRDDGAHFVNGRSVPEPAYSANHRPAFPFEASLTVREYGSRYVGLDPTETPFPASLRVRVEGNPEASWAASLLLWRAQRPVERVPLVFEGSRGEALVESLSGVTGAVLVTSQLQDSSHSPDDYDYATQRSFRYAFEEGPQPPPDASLPPDAVLPDAGAAPDAAAATGEEPGGCGCATGASAPAATLLAFAALGLAGLRRTRP